MRGLGPVLPSFHDNWSGAPPGRPDGGRGLPAGNTMAQEASK